MDKPVGQIIRELREERSLSKSRLARESGISDAYVVHIEKGTRTASEHVLRNIAKALHVPAHHLLLPSGIYDDAFVADVLKSADQQYAWREEDLGRSLTTEERERILFVTFEQIYRNRCSFNYEEYLEEEKQIERERDPLTMPSDEFWDWDTKKPWAPEGWQSLPQSRRDLVQQLVTSLLQPANDSIETDTEIPWAPEGWEDLTDRDRNLIQQHITRLLQIQRNE